MLALLAAILKVKFHTHLFGQSESNKTEKEAGC